MFLFIFLALSFNQPKFSVNVRWNPNAITFADNNTDLLSPSGIFISTDNTVYVVDSLNNQILIWDEGSTNITRIVSGGLNFPYSLFVTLTGDIYVDNGYSNGRVDKWTPNATNSTPAMFVNGPCYGLFVDIENNLYCSLFIGQQVIMKSLNGGINTATVRAGTGCIGSTSTTFYNPCGIFVDTNLNLYVADSGNNRIQLFLAGQLNGSTLVGSGSSDPITLYWPGGVVVDGNGNIFVIDSQNNRIVGSGPNGFRCLVGCSEIPNSGSDQLNEPNAISFDTSGDMFVADSYNCRVQKFLLETNAYGKSHNA